MNTTKSLNWRIASIAALLLASVAADHAWADRGYPGHPYRGYPHGGYRSSVGVGIVLGPVWSPWYYPAPYYYPPYPPVVIERTPPVYIEQAAPAPAPEATQINYWYYCGASRAYYPYVKECPSGWQRVSPQPPNRQ